MQFLVHWASDQHGLGSGGPPAHVFFLGQIPKYKGVIIHVNLFTWIHFWVLPLLLSWHVWNLMECHYLPMNYRLWLAMHAGQTVDRYWERNRFERWIVFFLSCFAGTPCQELHLLNYLEEARGEGENPFRRKREPTAKGAKATALKGEAKADSNNLPLSN